MKKSYIKILSVFVLCLFACTIFAGCSNASANLAKNIDSKLNEISKTIEEVGKIEESEIISSSLKTDLENNGYLTTKVSSNNPQNNNEKFVSVIKSISSTSSSQYANYSNYLYVNCDNALSTLNDLTNVQNQIKETINILQALTSKLKDNSLTVGESTINGCQECLENISLYNNKISLTRHEVNEQVRAIKKALQTKTISNEVLSSKYVKLSSTIDSRITNYNNILNLLLQLKCLLSGTGSSTDYTQNLTDNSSTICDENGNCYKIYTDENNITYYPYNCTNGVCYYCDENGKCYTTKNSNNIIYYPNCDSNGNCVYKDENGNILQENIVANNNKKDSDINTTEIAQKNVENNASTRQIINNNSNQKFEQREIRTIDSLPKRKYKPEPVYPEKTPKYVYPEDNQKPQDKGIEFAKHTQDNVETKNNKSNVQTQEIKQKNIDTYKQQTFSNNTTDTYSRANNSRQNSKAIAIISTPSKGKMPEKINGTNILINK